MRIIKAENTHRTAVFVVLEPDIEDRNGDVVDVGTITKAAHEFMLNLPDKAVNVNHEADTDVESSDAAYVESYVLPADLEGEDAEGNGYVIKAGSWMVGIKFSEAMWKKVLAGEFTGISMEGVGQYS